MSIVVVLPLLINSYLKGDYTGFDCFAFKECFGTGSDNASVCGSYGACLEYVFVTTPSSHIDGFTTGMIRVCATQIRIMVVQIVPLLEYVLASAILVAPD